jgi:hypothetical protein
MILEEIQEIFDKKENWYLHSYSADRSEFDFCNIHYPIHCKTKDETFEFIYVTKRTFILTSGIFESIKNEKHFDDTWNRFFNTAMMIYSQEE